MYKQVLIQKDAAVEFQDWKKMINSFLTLSEFCLYIKDITSNIKLLKLALTFTWKFHYENLELEIYDQIGKSYYIFGDLEKSKYYHHRSVEGITEDKFSPYRSQFLNILEKSESKYSNNSPNFKRLAIIKLDIEYLYTEQYKGFLLISYRKYLQNDKALQAKKSKLLSSENSNQIYNG